MKYKYTTTFSSEIKASVLSEDELKITKASVDNLDGLIPNGVDLDRNIDLLAIAFDAAVANRFNKNDDGIDAPTAVECAKYFVNKPINIEHIKQDIVGHVVSAGFSAYGSSQLIDASTDMSDQKDPFNISLGGLAYRTVNPSFVEFIEMCSDPESYAYGWVSASWEVGFNDYKIVIGGPNLKDSEIIEDPKHIQEFEKLLRGNGGEGVTANNERVYRLITGTVYPVGIGLTTNPAADVKGIYTKKKKEAVASEEESDSVSISVDNSKFLNNIKNFISHSKDTTVTSTKENTTMTNEELLAKITSLLQDKPEGDKQEAVAQEAVASVSKVIQEALVDRDKTYKEELESKENEKKEAEEALANQAKDLEEAKKDLAETKKDLEEIKAANEKREATELFNARMDEINEAYDLEDADRQVIATELATVEASDEAFDTYKAKVEVLFSHKNKESVAKLAKEKQKEIDEAVAAKLKELNEKGEIEVDVDKVLASAVEDNAEKPNNSDGTQEPSLREKMKDAFSKDHITVSI